MSDLHRVTAENELKEIQCVEKEKRIKKPTAKGLTMMFEKLQKERNVKFKEASKLKKQITILLASKENVSVVQQNLKMFKTLCEEACECHNKFFTEFSLPEEEQRKQETWFYTKVSSNDVFVEEVSTWLKENGVECVENAIGDEDAVNDNGGKNENEHASGDKEEAECYDDIKPGDSVSNVLSQRSSRKSHSHRSYASGVSSARLKAKAEKAALEEKAAALQRRQELEEQEEKLRQEKIKLRKRKEQMELDAQIAIAAARLSVLEGSSIVSGSDGMNSYLSKQLKVSKQEFNPKASEFVPKANIVAPGQGPTLPHVSLSDVRPKANMQTHLQDQIRTKDVTFRPQLRTNTGMSHTISLQHHSKNVFMDAKAAPLKPALSDHMPKHQLAQHGASVRNTVDQDAK